MDVLNGDLDKRYARIESIVEYEKKIYSQYAFNGVTKKDRTTP